MAASMSRQIAAFNKKYQKIVRAVGREAVQEVVSRAQAVVEEGGTMPIITGFLRASGQASIGAMPSGPVQNKGKVKYKPGQQAAGEPLSVVLLKWDINDGDPLYYGWTAVYAPFQESQKGFMRNAVAQWDVIVEDAAKKVRTEIG